MIKLCLYLVNELCDVVDCEQGQSISESSRVPRIRTLAVDEEVQALLRLVCTELFEGDKFQFGHCSGS